MSDAPEPPETLGAFDIACVVIGGIIGVGIFFAPQKVAARVDGSGQALLAWGLGGVMAIFGALVFADLCRRVPGHGGTFVYLRAAFGDLPAFTYGWANWLAIQSGALGVIGLVMVDYLDQLVYGEKVTGMDTKIVLTVLAILAFTALNVLGLRVGRRVQNTLTVIKTLAVFALVLLALLTSRAASPAPAAPVHAPSGRLLSLAGAMLPVLFAFGGWQQGSFLAGAAKRPRRDVPLGILVGVGVVVLAYLTVNVAYLDLLGFEGVASSPTIAEDATRRALEPYGLGAIAGRALSAMVVVSCLGIMNTICMAPPFVLHQMARAGVFVKAVGRLHPRTGSPTLAVLVQGLWGAVLVISARLVLGGEPERTLGILVDGVVFVDWLFFALCGLALLVLRRRGPSGLPGSGVVATVFFVLASCVTAGAIWSAPSASAVGLAICVSGVLVYLVFRRRW